MKYDKQLVEFTEAVKNALKTEGLWEHLQKRPGLRLPKDEHNFLRSVENIKVGRGPLNNFRLLQAIMAFLQWSPAKLFGLANSSVKASVNKVPKEIPAEDPVGTQVERALRRLEAQIEVKRIKLKEPRPKRSPGSRHRIFTLLAARTLRTIVASQNRLDWIFSEKQLFTSLTCLKPNYFGHLGKSFEYVDRMLAHSIERWDSKLVKRSIESELRLLACYQLTTLRTFLDPFEKNLPDTPGKKFRCFGGGEAEALFMHMMDSLPQLMEEIVKQEVHNQQISEKDQKILLSACCRVQEILHIVSSISVISPSIPSLENLTEIEKRNILLGKAINMDRFKDNTEVVNLQPWWLKRAALALAGLYHMLAPSQKPSITDFLKKFDISYDDLMVEVSQEESAQYQFNYQYIALAPEIMDLALLVKSPRKTVPEKKDEPDKGKVEKEIDNSESPMTTVGSVTPSIFGNFVISPEQFWTLGYANPESTEENDYNYGEVDVTPFTKKNRGFTVHPDNGERISPPRRTGSKSGDNSKK